MNHRRAEVGDVQVAPRRCPDCARRRTNPRESYPHMMPERGSWTGLWLWRCERCGRTRYEEDFT